MISSKIWFTSDLHFGHKNIIEYCNRPFQSVEEMDAELIRRWNVLVSDEDLVYVLGDFSFCGAKKSREILSQLKGKKILIRGNHDHSSNKMLSLGFEVVQDKSTHWIAGRHVLLSHYPYAPIENIGHDLRYMERRPADSGEWLLHGHVHEKWKTLRRMINVGVDVWGFAPASEHEIIAIITAHESQGF